MSERLEYIPDYTKTGKELLVDLLNYANSGSLLKPIRHNQIWFSKPVKLERDQECNTKISISEAVGYNGFEYPSDIEYNRLDIYQLALQLGFGFKIYVDKPLQIDSTRDLLEPLYQRFKVKLVLEDIIDEPLNIKQALLTAIENKADTIEIPITIRISDESIAYYGELPIVVSPKPIRLDTVIRKTRLPYSFVQIQRGGLS